MNKRLSKILEKNISANFTKFTNIYNGNNMKASLLKCKSIATGLYLAKDNEKALLHFNECCKSIYKSTTSVNTLKCQYMKAYLNAIKM